MVGNPVYLICAKCGSDDMEFRQNGYKASIYCNDCATITGIDEFNERRGKPLLYDDDDNLLGKPHD